MNDTADLLRAWVEQRSEDAYAKLVARHIDLVYSVAVRKVGGNSGLAADVTQTVFVDLARKAHALRAEGSLAGWLHRHTCYIAATAQRSELRRRRREETAAAMHALENSADPDWSRLAPLLDDAVNALDDPDRRAILLRFYEQRDLRSVGSLLGVSDDTAQKRVGRALEKLRGWLARHGVRSTSTAIAAMLGAHSVSAAPAGLAATVTSAAIAGTAAGAGAAITILEIMTQTKLKLTVAAAVAAAVVAPIAWQENAIATVRTENRALTAQAAPLDQLRAEQNALAAQPNAEDVAAQVARDRGELARLRTEVGTVRQQLQQARAARAAAAEAAAAKAKSNSSPLPPGLTSIAEAREVGAGTAEDLFQSFIHAMMTLDTNRVVQLADWSAEGAVKSMEDMLRDLPRAASQPDFQSQMTNMGYRVIRQLPLENGDVAIVTEVSKGDSPQRQGLRIRRIGSEWRIVMGKDGPQEAKLTEEQMKD